MGQAGQTQPATDIDILVDRARHAYYDELLAFLDAAGKLPDARQYLNAINPQAYASYLDRGFMDVAGEVERFFGRAYQDWLNQTKLEPEIRRKYSASPLGQQEIFSFLQSESSILWNQLQMYANQHAAIVQFQNQHWDRMGEAFARGGTGGTIGAALGTMILPGIGTAVGSLLGGMLAGASVGQEADEQWQQFLQHHSRFLETVDSTWTRLWDSPIPRLADEFDHRLSRIFEENSRVVEQKRRRHENAMQQLPASRGGTQKLSKVKRKPATPPPSNLTVAFLGAACGGLLVILVLILTKVIQI